MATPTLTFTPVREQPLPDWPTSTTTKDGTKHGGELRPAAPLARALSCAACGGLLREAVVAADCCLRAFCYDCVAGAALLLMPRKQQKKNGSSVSSTPPQKPRGRGRPTLAAAAAAAAAATSTPFPPKPSRGSAAAAAVDACPSCGALFGGNPWATGKLRYDPALDGLVRRVFPRPLLDAALERRRAERGAAERAARAAALERGRRSGWGHGGGGGLGHQQQQQPQEEEGKREEEKERAPGEEGDEGAAVAVALFPDDSGGKNRTAQLARPYVVVPAGAHVRDVAEHVRQMLRVEGEGDDQAPLVLRTVAGDEQAATPLAPELTVGEAARLAREEQAGRGDDVTEGAPPAPVVLYYGW